MNAGAGSSLHRIGGLRRDGLVPDGYAVRRAASDDIKAVAELVGAYDTMDFGRPDELGLEFLREGWPEMGEGTGAWIVLGPSGECAGFAVTSMEAGRDSVVEALGRVHPRDAGKGIGAALLDVTEAHARRRLSQGTADVRLRHDVSDSDSAARELLKHAGYDHVRRFFHMEIDVNIGAAPPAGAPGIAIRRARLPAEESVIHALHEAAFGDDWDFVPSGLAGWVLGSTRAPESDPGLWFVALEDGDIVGFLWARVWGAFGYVNDIAVAEDARGRGVGGALLRHAFAEFGRRGFTRVMLNVDADNPTGALRLYRKAGMRIRRRWDVYERVLGP